MDLPRLIIADEYRPGKMPAGVIVAAILKHLGYRLRLFVGGVDESSLRALDVMCGERVTVIDPVLCERKENLCRLFEEAASPDALNIVLTSIGARWSADSQLEVSPECKSLYEWLDCEMIPVIFSDTSSVVTVRAIKDILKQVPDGGGRIHSVLFRSVLSPREYQLVDMEVGRQLTSITLGSIPRELECDEPLMTDLCSERAISALSGLRDAADALRSMPGQISWAMFAALAKAAPAWQHQPPLVSPIKSKINIAVIRDQALSLGGIGTELMMRSLGVNVVDVPLDGNSGYTGTLHGVYIPHGLGYMAIMKMFSNIYVKALIARCSSGDSFMLAEGGAAPLLGDKITLPRGMSGGGEGRGFGVFPFSSVYGSPTFSAPFKAAAFSRRKPNPLVRGSQEWIWGYLSKSLAVTYSGCDPCWSIMQDINSIKEIMPDAAARGRILATTMRIEPWSAPALFKRWLEGER